MIRLCSKCGGNDDGRPCPGYRGLRPHPFPPKPGLRDEPEEKLPEHIGCLTALLVAALVVLTVFVAFTMLAWVGVEALVWVRAHV